ncbi:hypothetical protein IMAU30049_01949 [Lactobacillus helveticus]|uniref:hypothetical protein n=1 Tax=Lactobacillus helveticus TaxID=1587 RepID=UPI0019FCE514|nr:hypothetical protein [Lactobacillus helveticus]NRO69318.1 hypothetical protein [Lactobacillus helveticus]NRO71237.1 hypothetical protein [Lactobacillus helveticus]
MIADSDVEKITSALKEKLGKEDSKKKEDNEEFLHMIDQLKAENSKLKSENKEKDEELIRINSKKDEEIQRLRSMLMTSKNSMINSCN